MALPQASCCLQPPGDINSFSLNPISNSLSQQPHGKISEEISKNAKGDLEQEQDESNESIEGADEEEEDRNFEVESHSNQQN